MSSYPAIVSQRLQYNFDADSQREILRGTWFFQKSDGTMCPYDEETAAELEEAFFTARGSMRGSLCVEVGDKRSVHRAVEEGEFVQVQSDTQTSRWVSRRFFSGQLDMKTVTALEVVDQEDVAGGEGDTEVDLMPAPPLVVTKDESERGGMHARAFYFQRSNGSLHRYSQEICDALNAKYPPGKVVFNEAGSGVRIDEKRRVYRQVGDVRFPMGIQYSCNFASARAAGRRQSS